MSNHDELIVHLGLDTCIPGRLCGGTQIMREAAAALRSLLAAEVANKKQFERDWLEACDKQSAAESRLATADALLRKIRARRVGKLGYDSQPWLETRAAIDAHLAGETMRTDSGLGVKP